MRSKACSATDAALPDNEPGNARYPDTATRSGLDIYGVEPDAELLYQTESSTLDDIRADAGYGRDNHVDVIQVFVDLLLGAHDKFISGFGQMTRQPTTGFGKAFTA